MHQPPLRQIVVLDGPVLHGAIVPQQEIAWTPLVAIDEGRLDDVISQRGDQRLGFRRRDALDPGAVVAHDIEAFASGMGMRPDNRMGHRRGAVVLPFQWRERALSAGGGGKPPRPPPALSPTPPAPLPPPPPPPSFPLSPTPL